MLREILALLLLSCLCSAQIHDPNDGKPTVKVAFPESGEHIEGDTFSTSLEITNWNLGEQGQACLYLKRAQTLQDQTSCFSSLDTWTITVKPGTYLLEAKLWSHQGELVAQTQGWNEFVVGVMKPEGTDPQEVLNHLIDTTMTGEGDTDCHLMTLYSMVLQLKAKTILELGVREGVSTLPLLLGAHTSGGTLHSVDFFLNIFQPPDFLASSWVFHKHESKTWLAGLRSDIIFDMIFIDDWHSYEHVKTELELLEPHVTKKTVILMHDCMSQTVPEYTTEADLVGRLNFANGGPNRALKELDTSKWEYSTIPVCEGLTILRRLY